MEDRELRSVNMQVWKGLLRLMMSKGTVMELRMAVVVVVVVVVVVGVPPSPYRLGTISSISAPGQRGKMTKSLHSPK